MAGGLGDLTEERSLGAAVALSKRMDGVDLGVVVGQPLHELLALQSVKGTLPRQLREQRRQIWTDVLRQGKQVSPLGDPHRAKLASPRVQVTEDVAVGRLQMGEIVVAGDEAPFELSEANRAECCLLFGEVGCVAYPEAITQRVSAGIDVWVLSHRLTVSCVCVGALRVHRSEQLGKRLASADPSCRLVQLGVAEFSTRPTIQQILGDTWIETLDTNRSERVFGRLQTRSHRPILDPRLHG